MTKLILHANNDVKMHVPLKYGMLYIHPYAWVHFGAPLKGLVEHLNWVVHYTYEGVVLEHAREHP